ncbi:hypothetical protein SSS_10307 [Sarcoptes scabiei]|nr:hypothetical protein SSS_10307 [Sarcoptes scabiei]
MIEKINPISRTIKRIPIMMKVIMEMIIPMTVEIHRRNFHHRNNSKSNQYRIFHTVHRKCFDWRYHTPGSFYVLNNDNQKEYELLEQSIQEFYSNNSSKKVSIHSGQYYAAKYPAKNIWARAKCLTKLNSTAIVGLFIDYGIVAEVSLDSLRSLDSQFTSLPPRSFKTALSGHDDTIWSSAVVAHFKKLVEGITFSVINEETDSPNDRRSLLATDDLSINEEMIEFISNN